MMLLDPHDKGDGFSFPMLLHQLANGVGGSSRSLVGPSTLASLSNRRNSSRAILLGLESSSSSGRQIGKGQASVQVTWLLLA